MDEIKKRIEALQRRHTQAQQRKAGAAGQLQARKDELASIVQEIRDAGYDPKQITQLREQAEAELLTEIEKYEAALTEIETVLNGFPPAR